MIDWWRRRRRVLFVGDSITGMLGYVAQVADVLRRWDVSNAGCGMSTSWQWQLEGPAPGVHCKMGEPSSLFDLLAAPHLPVDLAYIMLGSGDAQFQAAVLDPLDDPLRQPTPVDVYKESIATLAERLHVGGAETVVLLRPPDPNPTWGANAPDGGARFRGNLADYRIAMEELTSGPACGEGDWLQLGPNMGPRLTEEADFADHIHPGPQGHTKIATAVLNDLRRRQRRQWRTRRARSSSLADY